MNITSKEKINVLSLFDGMSCGQIALKNLGINVENYLASEIKEDAISVAKENFPNMKHIGDVKLIQGSYLPKIDLLIGGSPCQDLSNANKTRLGLEGQKSGLFWEYVRLLKECNPKYFLLENVKMKPDQEKIITEALRVEPIQINSALVSGQNRKRLYWTNIPNVSQPEDRGIDLQDVLTEGYTNLNKSRALLESDSRPVIKPVKRYHRYHKFMTFIFNDENHYLACKKHYDENFKGLPAKEILGEPEVYNGIRVLNQTELERLQGVPEGYTRSISRNEAAGLLGDGWTIPVIEHILKGMN